MSYLIPGMLLQPIEGCTLIQSVVRVLYVTTDTVVVIPISPRRYKNRTYYESYTHLPRVEIEAQSDGNDPLIAVVEEGMPEGDSMLSDEELAKKYRRKGQSESSTFAKLKERWTLLEPLVMDPDACLLFDPHMLHLLVKRHVDALASPNQNKQTKKRQVLQLLYQYWAGNSLRRALVPAFGSCGGRGKERKHYRSLGRRPANSPTRQSFRLTPRVKDIIAQSWRIFYIRGKTRAKAYRKMCRAYFSEVVRKDNGDIVYKLFASDQRPSRWQFNYWGPKLNPGDAAWKRKFAATSLARISRALLGTNRDKVTALGQCASVDSSPPDLEFVSVLGHELIGGGNRMLVMDVKTGYIPGFYYGIDAPSAKTVNLAFLHAIDLLPENSPELN